MRSTLCFSVLVWTYCAWSIAEEVKPTELTLHSRAIEAPVLKYRLLPAESEIKPGNPVPILLRLPWDRRSFMSSVFPTFQEWLDIPLDDPKWANSNGVLPEQIYSEIRRAAFRRDVNWEYPIDETSSPYLILLADVQDLRGWLARGLSAKIRYHTSRKEFDQAREGIMVGLANSRHIAHSTFYVTQFVAAAIQQEMLARLEELISQPDSPNLYWALSQLPESLVDFHRAASFESSIFVLTFPAINDFDRPRDDKEWKRMAEQFEQLLVKIGDLPAKAKANGIDNPYLKSITAKARQDLSTLTGIPTGKVARMSDEEVSLRWYSHRRISYDQRLSIVLTLPPAEAWPAIRQLQFERDSLNITTQTSSSDPVHVYQSTLVIHRRIQALRIIEAIRHYMSSHNDRLPDSLDEIKDIPIPLDRITGRPFIWKVEDKLGTLSAPPLHLDPIVVQSQLSDSVKARGRLEYSLKGK